MYNHEHHIGCKMGDQPKRSPELRWLVTVTKAQNQTAEGPISRVVLLCLTAGVIYMHIHTHVVPTSGYCSHLTGPFSVVTGNRVGCCFVFLFVEVSCHISLNPVILETTRLKGKTLIWPLGVETKCKLKLTGRRVTWSVQDWDLEQMLDECRLNRLVMYRAMSVGHPLHLNSLPAEGVYKP